MQRQVKVSSWNLTIGSFDCIGMYAQAQARAHLMWGKRLFWFEGTDQRIIARVPIVRMRLVLMQ